MMTKTAMGKAALLVFCGAGMTVPGFANQDSNGAAAAAATTAARAAATDVHAETFDQNFFTQYAPQNAYDMIVRLPGFSFDAGSDARGFGGTAGNVLIDGTRPTSKAGGIREALRRIPASQVERIDLQRGGVGAGEAAGQSVIANVVRVKGKSSGTWAVEMRKVGENKITPMLDGTFATQIAGWATSFQLDTFLLKTDRDAVITRLDTSGNLVRRSLEDRPERERDGTFSFDAARDIAGGRLQINGRLAYNSWLGDTEQLGLGLGDIDDPVQDRFYNVHDWREWEGELGADYSRTFGSGWKLRLIGLSNFEDWTETDDFTEEEPLGTLTETGFFRTDERSTETILRTTVGQTTGAFKPEFGIEGAINTLTRTLAIDINDGDGNETFHLDPETVEAKELRSEIFANMVWQPSSKLTLDAGTRFEISRISTKGGNAETFTYLKPSLGLSYTMSPQLQLGLKASRSVGQLDFSDFAASIDAVDDRAFAGNPDLRPDRTDRLEAKLDYTFGERGALTATLYHEWKDDVIERTILEGGGQGVANIGSARRWGLDTELNLPIDFILKGGLIEAEVYLFRERFLDPITNEHRQRNGFTPSAIQINFRHDIPDTQWAWGVEHHSNFTEYYYFINEREEFKGNNSFNIFVETTQFFGVKTSLVAYDINGRHFERQRYFYSPTRGDAFVGSELQDRTRDMGLKLVISGQF